jgi:hypothetical protein
VAQSGGAEEEQMAQSSGLSSSFAGRLLAWTLSGLAAAAASCGSSNPRSGSPTPTRAVDQVTPDDAVYRELDAQKAAFVQYESTPVEYTLSVEGYTLPLEAASVPNLERDVRGNPLLQWSAEAEATLLEHGLVLLPDTGRSRQFESAYDRLVSAQIPILVTTDSTLHLYHVFFEQLLKNVELERLIPMHKALLPALADRLAAVYAALDGDLREAARRDLAFVSVAGVLLDPARFAVYDVVSDEVAAVVQKVEAASEPDVDPIFDRDCGRELACSGGDLDDAAYLEGQACLCEDYTQYRPRGHYTEHADLQKYFRSAMYLGRMGLRIKSPMETRMAALLTAALGKTDVEYAGSVLPAAEIWNRVYRVTSFFAGTSDDLTFVEYDRVLRAVYGEGFELADLASDPDLEGLRQALREEREPEVVSGFVRVGLDKSEQTMGLRFMGQRFAFDSYVLGQLVWDSVGPNPLDPNYDYVLENLVADCRVPVRDEPITEQFESCEAQTVSDWGYVCCSAITLAQLEDRPELAEVCRLLPTGLDVAAAFGSTRAREHLQPDIDGYCGYAQQLEAVAQEASEFALQDWGKNLYTAWLYSLDPFLTRDFAGFPTWMTGNAYADKGLSTALASWAELRHDTILYVKQSYTGVGGWVGIQVPPPEAMYYVEPVPETYSRLADLARMTERGLDGLGMFPDRVRSPTVRLVDLLDALKETSIHELAGLPLSSGELELIKAIGATFESVLTELGSAVTVPPTESAPDDPNHPVAESMQGDPFKTTVVADVHTDGNMQQVLEVGSGYIDWLVVVNRLTDGSLGATIGPVMSYYEFAWPMDRRLTDDEWQQLLGSADCPARPAFLGAILMGR